MVVKAKLCGHGVNDPDIIKKVGKTAVLAFGYMGGVPAFRKFQPRGTNYTDEEITQFRDTWRREHPMIVRYWDKLNNAAIDAVRNRGKAYRVGRVAFKV
jgi:hypothetical protein